MSHEQWSPDERQLSDVLSEFARIMAPVNFQMQSILDFLVERVVEMLPVRAATVTIISGADSRKIAAADGSEPRFDGLKSVCAVPIRHGDQQLGALHLFGLQGETVSSEARKTAQTLADVAAAYLVNAQARVDLQDSSDRAREVSLHDALTGLPNRMLLLQRLAHTILRNRRSGKTAAVLFVDLDGFKLVNDLHGHDIGDELLVGVARRLSGLVRPPDTVARLYGDEFVILCEDLDAHDQAAAIGARLQNVLTAPFIISGVEIELTASVGVAFAETGHTPEGLLHDADTAMYQAKRKGGARVQIFDLGHGRRADLKAGLERDLHGALGRGEMHIEYQPLVSSGDGRILGFEALLRWMHPTRGPVAPAIFIPLAEQAGLISEIGRWVLTRALADRERWQAQFGGDHLGMSVNVSAQQLMSAGFAASVAAILRSADSSPGLLTLEVTESVFVRDSERALLVLNDLKQIGVMLALDDFGAGYLSLQYLRRFPMDMIKVDREFVADLGRNLVTDVIVRSVIQLAHALGMSVVAEGVETDLQLDEVTDLGCDYCQGFYFARPMPASMVDQLIPRGLGAGLPRLPRHAATA